MEPKPSRGSNARLIASVVLLAIVFFLLNVGCSVFQPLPKRTSVADRLAAFPTANVPVEKRVTIYWDRHMIPFIDAQTDDDAAFALGMVHAHLRLGQMEILRHAAEGRLSEMAGPFALKFDRSIRIVGLGRSAKAIYEQMPPETRSWVDNFVRGINFVQANLRDLPIEYKVCGLKREPWTPEDVITIEHLGGADVNWLQWFSLLPQHGKPNWKQLWERRLREGADSPPSFSPDEATWPMSSMIKSGSNCFVISGARRGGAAVIASDPHLGVTIPSVWLIVGLKSPSYNTVGLMFPAVPFVALGRNERIAWGGTNMRSASSDLYDVSKEPAESIASRQEKIKVRWWFDRTVTIRESRLGPIISDAPLLSAYNGPALAVHWVGHEPSDEFTAMLRATKAGNWTEFRSAFGTYAVPGMNILYADAEGNIGQLMAVTLPIRQNAVPEDIVLDPAKPENLWKGLLNPTQLPSAFNPKQGYLVSCNNLPVKMMPPVGYFFSAPDRFLRISELLAAKSPINLDGVGKIQRDVHSDADAEMRDRLVKEMNDAGIADEVARTNSAFMAALKNWDGYYDTDSTGAVAFQLLRYHLNPGRGARGEGNSAIATGVALREGAIAAAKDYGEFKDWGEMHRLQIAHMFASVPLIGRKYRFGDYPAAGSNETVWKTTHPVTNQRSFSHFGSSARHISDMADADENYFLILGGQDGWLNSEATLDQVPMWLKGEYIQVPLRLDSVRRAFPLRTVIGN